jgi:hypothetical protein
MDKFAPSTSPRFAEAADGHSSAFLAADFDGVPAIRVAYIQLQRVYIHLPDFFMTSKIPIPILIERVTFCPWMSGLRGCSSMASSLNSSDGM